MQAFINFHFPWTLLLFCRNGLHRFELGFLFVWDGWLMKNDLLRIEIMHFNGKALLLCFLPWPMCHIKAHRFHFSCVRWLWAAKPHIHFSGPGVNLTQCHPPCSSLSHSNQEERSLQQFARRTSLHGLVHVVEKGSSGVQNCLWTFAFIECLSLFVYHSISGIMHYFEFPHITKLEEEVASEKTFPAFTFCNVNPLRKSAFAAFDIEHLREIWRIPAEHTESITSP